MLSGIPRDRADAGCGIADSPCTVPGEVTNHMDLSDVRVRLCAVDSEYANRLDRDNPWTILDAVMAAVRDLCSDVSASIVLAEHQQREREDFGRGALNSHDPA